MRYSKNIKIILVVSIFLLFPSCKNNLHINTTFYYWKTNYRETDIADVLKKSTRLYVRICDVDIDDKKVQPIAPIIWKEKPSLPIVPVVYITNRTIDFLDTAGIDALATNILNFSKSKVAVFDEIQIDCDWTITTKDKYFRLLQKIKGHLDKGQILSATIRLHQIKFANKTGIPPVDRGVLMLYNMAPLKNYDTFNSIYDAQIIDSYLENITEYYLPLDLALPLYRQLVVFKNKKYFGVIREPDFFEVSKSDYFKYDHANIYECVKDTTINNLYINNGSHIRVEKPIDRTFDRFMQNISKINNNDTLNIIYFDVHSHQ